MKLAFYCAFLLLLSSFELSAALLGTDITVDYQLAGATYTDVVTVGSGDEFTCPGAQQICNALTAPTQTIDISDTSILYTYTGPGASFNPSTPNGITFSGFPLTSYTLTSDIPGLDNSRVSSTANSITLNLSGLTLSSPTSSFRLDLQTSAVPEPSTFGLIAAAAVVLGHFAAKKR